jgi:putative acetyltransferase
VTAGATLVRAAISSDAESIATVHVAAIRELCGQVYEANLIDAWTSGKRPEGYLDAIARNPFFVAVLDRDVVGFSELDPQTGEVRAVYVQPTCVRQGIGRKLLQAVETAACELPLTRLHLHATLNAVSFYEAHGYVMDGPGTVVLRGGTNLPCGNMHKNLDV